MPAPWFSVDGPWPKHSSRLTLGFHPEQPTFNCRSIGGAYTQTISVRFSVTIQKGYHCRMAPSAIVVKLNAVIAEPVDNEYKVVYVMCQVRKLLEHALASKRLFTLNMYCHWALHVDLHGKDTIANFLEQIDTYVDRFLAGKEDLSASYQLVRDLAVFATFRSQLRDFLRATGIQTKLTDDDARWSEFVKHYAGVIEDGSLSFHSKDNKLKHLKQVTFVKGKDAVGEHAQIPFDLTWSLALLDGRNLYIDLNAHARSAENGASPMISWRTRLHEPRSPRCMNA